MNAVNANLDFDAPEDAFRAKYPNKKITRVLKSDKSALVESDRGSVFVARHANGKWNIYDGQRIGVTYYDTTLRTYVNTELHEILIVVTLLTPVPSPTARTA